MTPPLRARTGAASRVSTAELFFDLVYAFAVTQISHYLLGHLSLFGGLQTLVLWFAVWLGWQYTCWVTNWFDPDGAKVRGLLFGVMLLALVMAAALPEAFAGRGLVVACCFAAMQVGRSVYVLHLLGGDHALRANFQRILGWNGIAAIFWIAGGLAGGPARLALWIVAVACEYVSPMFGFRLPGLGRSVTSDWTIEGGHLAERCQCFVLVALGESILVTGAALGEGTLDAPTVIAFLVAFLGSLALWWLYFDTGSEAASRAIADSNDPGRLGALFHYIHVIIIGGIIVAAVANDLVIAHPDARIAADTAAVLMGGPALYLFGNGLHKTVVHGRFPLSHLTGLAACAVLWSLAWHTDRLMVAGLATAVLAAVAAWESRARSEA